jgi:hypothetical protein
MVDARQALRRSQRLPGRAAGPQDQLQPRPAVSWHRRVGSCCATAPSPTVRRYPLPNLGHASRWPDQEACTGRRRTSKPPENRKPLAPEDAGRVGFDLIQRACRQHQGRDRRNGASGRRGPDGEGEPEPGALRYLRILATSVSGGSGTRTTLQPELAAQSQDRQDWIGHELTGPKLDQCGLYF